MWMVGIPMGALLTGCCKSKEVEETPRVKSGETCEVVLEDDFTGPLETNWRRGTNAKHNPKGPTVDARGGQLSFTQHYDYIETKASVSGDFSVELLGVSRKAGSNQCADLYVQLAAAPEQSGIFRFSYGTDRKESINLGKGVREEGVRGWDCIRDSSYLKELDATPASSGRLTLEHEAGRVRLRYTNHEQRTISTDWVQVQPFESTTVRIWGLGRKGSERNVEKVRICREKKPDAVGSREATKAEGNRAVREEGSKIRRAEIPLEMGNTWSYRFRSAGVAGTFSYTVGAKERIGDTDVFRMDYKSNIALYEDGYWQLVANQKDGYYFFGDKLRGRADEPDLWLKVPSKVGDGWQTKWGSDVRWQVISTSETVTVPAGTFENCVRIRGTPAGLSEGTDHWWAMGIGEIRMHQPGDSTPRMSFELESYSFR